MTVTFKRATKAQSKLRMAIDGPSGSGKTYTALTFATALAAGKTIAVIDTERGSASKYADRFTFDVLELTDFAPQNYIEAIKSAEQVGYTVIVLDSISHAWEGTGGSLEQHEKATMREPGRNSYTAWRDVTKVQNDFVAAMLQSTAHIIVTMRAKMDYIQVKNDEGKTKIEKVGLNPVQRNGIEYEFDIVADLDAKHTMVIGKSRCFEVDGDVVNKPGAEWFAKVQAWLSDGTQPVPKPPTEQAVQPTPQTWTADAKVIARIHVFIASECTRTGLEFPAKGPESAYELIKIEALDLPLDEKGERHLASYTGTMGEFKVSVTKWFNEQVDIMMKQKLQAGEAKQ